MLNEEVNDICYLINNHDKLIDMKKVNEDNLELTKKLLYIQYCDAYAHHPEHIEERIERLDRVLGKLEKQGVLQ